MRDTHTSSLGVPGIAAPELPSRRPILGFTTRTVMEDDGLVVTSIQINPWLFNKTENRWVWPDGRSQFVNLAWRVGAMRLEVYDRCIPMLTSLDDLMDYLRRFAEASPNKSPTFEQVVTALKEFGYAQIGEHYERLTPPPKGPM